VLAALPFEHKIRLTDGTHIGSTKHCQSRLGLLGKRFSVARRSPPIYRAPLSAGSCRFSRQSYS
jgi:hypothetical protein